MGRSTDLATISEIKKIELEKQTNVKLGKTILPLGLNGAFGTIQALPTHFTGTIPRKAVRTKTIYINESIF